MYPFATGSIPPAEKTIPSPPPMFKVIDLGEISSDKFEAILKQMSRAWGKEIAPLMRPKPLTFKEQLKSDCTNAAYRVGSTQLISVTKNFLVQYARKSCDDESKVLALAELLDTEIGSALLAMFIGFAVSQVPQLANHPKMQRLLKEFRVSGLTTIGNAAVEAIFTNMLPVIASAIQGIEKANTEETVSNLPTEEDLLLSNQELETPAPLLRQS